MVYDVFILTKIWMAFVSKSTSWSFVGLCFTIISLDKINSHEAILNFNVFGMGMEGRMDFQVALVIIMDNDNTIF